MNNFMRYAQVLVAGVKIDTNRAVLAQYMVYTKHNEHLSVVTKIWK